MTSPVDENSIAILDGWVIKEVRGKCILDVTFGRFTI
jgi:hypothetical protein